MKNYIVFTLFNTNALLSKSLRYPWLYGLATAIFCALIITTVVIDLFIYKFDGKDYSSLFLSIVYIVVFSDLLLIISRVQNRSFIRPHHLKLFPIGYWKKLLYSCSVYAMDLKSFIYITAVVCFLIYFISMNMFFSAILSVFVWLLLFLCILIWTGALYQYFGKYLNKFEGQKTRYLGFFFIAIVLASQIFGNDIYTKIPVISYASNALYGLQYQNLVTTGTQIILLIFSAFIPLLLMGMDTLHRYFRKS